MSIISDPHDDSKPPIRSSRSRQTISLMVLVGVILAFAVLFYQVIRPMFLPLFLGAIFALLATPFQRWLVERGRMPTWLASLLIVLLIMLVVILPTTAGFFLTKGKVQQTIHTLEATAKDPESRDRLFEWVGQWVEVNPDELQDQALQLLRESEAILFQRAMKALGSVTAFLLGGLLFLVAAFFFLKDGEAILKAWEEITPLDPEQDRQIRLRFAVVCRGVVMSILLAALAQALVLGLGLVLLDVIFGIGLGPWIIVLVLAAGLLAMIPVIGPFVVWIPVAGYLFYDGQYVAAILLVLHGSIIVGNIDNLVRIMVLQGTAQMHPLMGLISILGGVQLLGVVGIFVGPIVAAVFVSLLRILRQQLTAMDRPPRESIATPGPAP
ncbi:AI-2E family transporter [soil metagenome]